MYIIKNQRRLNETEPLCILVTHTVLHTFQFIR